MCQIFNDRIRVNSRPIITYKILKRDLTKRDLYHSINHFFTWIKNAQYSSEISIGKIPCENESPWNEYIIGMPCINNGFHSYRKLKEVKNLMVDGRIRVIAKMIIPKGSICITGIEESTGAKTIVSNKMILDKIIKKEEINKLIFKDTCESIKNTIGKIFLPHKYM